MQIHAGPLRCFFALPEGSTATSLGGMPTAARLCPPRAANEPSAPIAAVLPPPRVTVSAASPAPISASPRTDSATRRDVFRAACKEPRLLAGSLLTQIQECTPCGPPQGADTTTSCAASRSSSTSTRSRAPSNVSLPLLCSLHRSLVPTRRRASKPVGSCTSHTEGAAATAASSSGGGGGAAQKPVGMAARAARGLGAFSETCQGDSREQTLSSSGSVRGIDDGTSARLTDQLCVV